MVAALAAFGTAAARAEERTLALEVVINDRATGQLAVFTQRDGKLYAPAADLREVGLRVPSGQEDAGEPIELNSLPGVRAQVNERRQVVVIHADDASLRPQQLGGPRDYRREVPLTPSLTGLMLNYDTVATWSNGQVFGGGMLDGRVFSPFGTFSTSAYGLYAPQRTQSPLLRLDSTWSYAEPEAMRRWRVGDFINGGLGWTRPVRMGGVQVATDFAMRPDLITFPLPTLSGSALVPSTVDVMVNGIQQLSQPVTPGPFEVRSLPIVTGAGEVAIAVQDALGRQTITRVPFYASTSLLAEGLTAYSLEGGFIRRRYFYESANYGSWVTSGSVRRGLTDWLTLEGHAEGTNGLALAGLGASMRIGSLGVITGAISGSSANGQNAGQLSGAIERRTGTLSMSLAGSIASDGYRDIAAMNGVAVPRTSLRASLGLNLNPYGSFGLAYVDQRPMAERTSRQDTPIGSANVQLVTASYSVRLTDQLSFYTTGYANLRQQDASGRSGSVGYGVMAGITLALNGYGASSTISLDNGRSSTINQASKLATTPGEVGVRIVDSEGFVGRRTAEAEYWSNYGRIMAGVDNASGVTSGRVGARGSVVYGDGGLFPVDSIMDSFAIVQTGDVGGVGISYENRPIGQTNENGRLLVPYLRSFQPNRLTVRAEDLPPDVRAERTDIQVRPSERTGVLVDFGVRRDASALVRLVLPGGEAVPLGSRVTGRGDMDLVIGHDGEVYVGGLQPRNTLRIELRDGGSCQVSFPFVASPGELPVIGPLRCE